MITLFIRLERFLTLPALMMSAFVLSITCELNAITFADWQAANFTTAELANPTISGPDADPAHDGIRNFLKYAEGLPPKVPSTIGQAITQSWESLNYQALSFKQNNNATDLTYVVEVSTDLKTWERGYGSTWWAGETDLGNGWSRIKNAAWETRLDAPRGFMRLTVLKDHALPADWLMRYFGTSTGIDSEGDEDLDGYTNFEEFIYGYSPLDFYNGYLPSLQFLSGGGIQWGLAGSVLTQPISVTVNSGANNAPVTFSVTAGGALLSLDGSTNWNSSIQTRTSTSGDYSALVHVKLPSTVGQVSTITATAGTGTKMASVSAYAGVFDPNTSPPINLTAAGTGPDSVELTWTNSDPTKATTIEMSEDDGGSWVIVGVAAPGVTQAFITGLTPDLKVSFRLRTGGTPLAGSGSPAFFGKPIGTQGSPSSGPVSSSGTQKEATPLASPKFLGRQSSYYGYKYGFAGFITDTNRYLQKTVVTSSTETNNDGDGGTGTETTIVDAKTGQETITHTGDSGVENYVGEVVIVSDTRQTGHGEDDDGSGETSDSSTTLSNLYSTATLQANVESWVPPYSGEFSPYYNNTARIHLSDDELNYSLTKLQFKWQVNKDPDPVVYWLEIFTPDDGSAPVVEQKSWATGGATESQLYEINPATKNGKKNGTYKVVQIELRQPKLEADGVRASGSPVPTGAPRFARWQNGFTEPGGQFKTDWISSDPDRVVVRIPTEMVNESIAFIGVQTAGIIDVAGRTTDTGVLQLHQVGGFWESDPFLLVTDVVDADTWNGDLPAVSGVPIDQTRLAGFGADIKVKVYLKGQSAQTQFSVMKMPKPKYTIKVQMNILYPSFQTVNAAAKQRAQSYVDTAKLLYRQIGVDLVQQGTVGTVALRQDFTAIANGGGEIGADTVGSSDGKTFKEYLINMSTNNNMIKVYVTPFGLTLPDHEGEGVLGWAPIRPQPGDFAILSFIDSDLAGGYLVAHELGHALGADHPDDTGSYPHRIMNKKLSNHNGDHQDEKRFGAEDQDSFVGGKLYK